MLSKDARDFLDTAFELTLSDGWMGGPTPAERANIEMVRAEIEAAIAATAGQEGQGVEADWEDVPEGTYKVTPLKAIRILPGRIHLLTHPDDPEKGTAMGAPMPSDWRLQRQRPAQQTAAGEE